MTNLTREQSRRAARAFIAAYVTTGRQWHTWSMGSYLPSGWELRDMAEFSDNPTVANIARFLQLEAVPQ